MLCVQPLPLHLLRMLTRRPTSCTRAAPQGRAAASKYPGVFYFEGRFTAQFTWGGKQVRKKIQLFFSPGANMMRSGEEVIVAVASSHFVNVVVVLLEHASQTVLLHICIFFFVSFFFFSAIPHWLPWVVTTTLRFFAAKGNDEKGGIESHPLTCFYHLAPLLTARCMRYDVYVLARTSLTSLYLILWCVICLFVSARFFSTSWAATIAKWRRITWCGGRRRKSW